jgi:hypothetical protein
MQSDDAVSLAAQGAVVANSCEKKLRLALRCGLKMFEHVLGIVM